MILSGFALKTLENQLPRLLKNEQNDTVLQSEFDICTEQELKNKNNKKKKKKMQIRNIISSYAVNKIVSSLNLNKEIVAESDLLESSFKEIKSNPSGKSDNDFFMRQN